jgi:hypothetical protein
MARLGEGAGAGGRVGSRESIFKISHTKVREKVQNPDLRSDLARAHLQMARWVYEGGRAERAGRAAGRVAAKGGVSCGRSPPSRPWPAPRSRSPAPSGTPPTYTRAPNGGPAGLTSPPGLPWGAEEPWPPLGRGLGGGAIELGAVFGRESIFKISHTKSQKKVQNLDPGSDLARTSMHLARRVYEGGRAGTKGQWADGAWGGCPGNPWAPLQAQRELLTYPFNSYRAALEQLPTVCRRFCR